MYNGNIYNYDLSIKLWYLNYTANTLLQAKVGTTESLEYNNWKHLEASPLVNISAS